MSFFDEVNNAYDKGIKARIGDEGINIIKAKARGKEELVKTSQERDEEFSR